jgi:hypothetical protein
MWRLVVLCALAPVALAHPGPRVWVNVENGKITTWAGPYPPSDPSKYVRSRVFTQAMTEDEGIWGTDYPGFQMLPGGSIPSGTTFGYDITGPLLWYEPTGFVQARVHFATPSPQFGIFNELFQVKYTGDGFVGGDPAFAHNGYGDHNHLSYALLGDGTTPGGGTTDGIFGLQLRLNSDGLTPSDTYFLLLGKNAPPAALEGAAALARTTIVLPGDANSDGVVDFSDFQTLERGFGKSTPLWSDGDFDMDRDVDHDDFSILFCQFGKRGEVTASAVAIPEPGALGLVGLVCLVFRRNAK